MPDWIKYRIPKKLLDNKNKNIKIEEFNESKHKDIIPQIYADAFCDKAWESDWYKIDLFNPASVQINLLYSPCIFSSSADKSRSCFLQCSSSVSASLICKNGILRRKDEPVHLKIDFCVKIPFIYMTFFFIFIILFLN